VELECLEGDLLAPFKGRKADFIVCNPPYVSQEEYVALDPSVREFEPKMALVGGVLGVEFYQRLAQELPSFLNQGASLFFEIGSTQANRLKTIFSAPIWQESQVHKDWSGRDRFFFLKYNQLL
jgi:release factor glutamine methyltransferase